MIYSTSERDSKISKIIGPSCWLNVTSSSEDKWVAEEGEVVVGILNKLLHEGISEPDIYIISPFKAVAQNMRDRLRNEHTFARTIENNPKWIYERIGTVHTFQGKEAEAVIFLLGAPHQNSKGARKWAGRNPNLVNVAATRAKNSLYVVGNRDSWRTEGAFKILSEELP